MVTCQRVRNGLGSYENYSDFFSRQRTERLERQGSCPRCEVMDACTSHKQEKRIAEQPLSLEAEVPAPGARIRKAA